MQIHVIDSLFRFVCFVTIFRAGSLGPQWQLQMVLALALTLTLTLPWFGSAFGLQGTPGY